MAVTLLNRVAGAQVHVGKHEVDASGKCQHTAAATHRPFTAHTPLLPANLRRIAAASPLTCDIEGTPNSRPTAAATVGAIGRKTPTSVGGQQWRQQGKQADRQKRGR